MRNFAWPVAAALLAMAPLASSTSGCILRGPVPLGSRGPRYAPATGCPFGVPGVRVETLETDEGIDVVLTTGGGTLDNLRNRAHYALQGKTEPGMSAPPGVERVAALKAKAHVDVEDVNGGVAIRVTAEDPKETDNLRDEIYDRLEAVEDPDVCK